MGSYSYSIDGINYQAGTTFSGLAANSYTVTVKNASGCVSNGTSAVVNAQPATPSAPNIVSITQPTCAIPTGTVVLNGLPSGNWTINPGAITGNTASATISNLAAGTTYNFTVTNAAGCTSSSVAVVINAQPSSPTVASITGPTSVCVGNSIQLSDATPGGTWSSSNNFRATVDNTGFVTGVSSNGNGVTIMYTISNSCGTITASRFITVNSSPTASIHYSSSAFCETGTATVSRSGQSGGTYSSSAGLSINSSTGAINLGASAAGTYTVTYSFSNGNCSNTATTSVTIVALPAASISYAGSPYCRTGTATVTRSGQTGGTYSSTGGLNINSSTGTINLAASTAGTYTVTYTFSNGSCSGTTSTTVTIFGAPTVSSITGTATVCVGNSTQLSDAVSGGVWSSSNVSRATVDNTGFVTGVGAGSVTISYVVNNGCGIATATRTVTVNATPTATIAYTHSPYCTNGGTATVTRSGQSGGRYSSARGLSISSSTGAINLDRSTPGTYIVTYTFSNGTCTNTATASVTINNCGNANVNNGGNNGNLKQLAVSNLSINAFPNPTQNYFNLKISSSSEADVVVRVFDISGRLIVQMSGSVDQVYHFGETFVAGVYVVQVQQGTQSATTKVIKQ